MKLLQATVEYVVEVLQHISRIGKPKPVPSLLALNIDWFTHCTWTEQLIAFKQIDEYYWK